MNHEMRFGEQRWPAAAAALIALTLYMTLRKELTLGPYWVMPVVVIGLLIPLLLIAPRRHPEERSLFRAMAILLIAVLTAGNVISLVLLIQEIIRGTGASGIVLITSAIQIWLTNVIVFGLWYWEMDRGGPSRRVLVKHREPDFLFPQMSSPNFAPTNWKPTFMDYLYVALTNAAAFSPTDTMPLTPRAKALMGIQSLASFLTVALVTARAVNILR